MFDKNQTSLLFLAYSVVGKTVNFQFSMFYEVLIKL